MIDIIFFFLILSYVLLYVKLFYTYGFDLKKQYILYLSVVFQNKLKKQTNKKTHTEN